MFDNDIQIRRAAKSGRRSRAALRMRATLSNTYATTMVIISASASRVILRNTSIATHMRMISNTSK